MDINLDKNNKPYSEDMAAYFNKLLRQDYRHPPEASSRPSWEHTPEVQHPSQLEIAPPLDEVQTQEREAPAAEPAVAKPPKDKAKKRPRQILRHRQTKVGRRRTQNPRNARQTAMVALIPVLAVTLLVLVRQPSGSAASVPAPAGLDMSRTLPETDPEVTIDWEVPLRYQSAGRDPMRSVVLSIVVPDAPVSEETTPTKLVLRGILYSEDRPAVIIGTNLLHTGDEISGARIVKINRDSVEFEADGRTWEQTVTSAEKTDDRTNSP